MSKKNAGIYIRVSTEDQAREGFSLGGFYKRIKNINVGIAKLFIKNNTE